MSRLPDPVTTSLDLERQVGEDVAEFEAKAEVLPERLAEMATIDVGQTPHDVVYEENKLRLLHYEPLTDDQRDVPLLLVYALINRPYILDLQPAKSVVRRFLEHGFDVYMIQWNEPSRLDRHLTLDHYVNVYIDNCVDAVRERAREDAINVLGYCMGGTMSAMYAALHPEKVRNLALLATGLYFDDSAGLLERWGDDFDPELLTRAYGNIPREFLEFGFRDMNPVNNFVTKYVQLYRRLDDEEFVENFARMERWLSEGVDLAGDAYVQFLEDIYQANKLYENDLHLGAHHVDIGRIDMPVLLIVGEYDNLIPPSASVPFLDVIPSEDTAVEQFSAGHVGLAVSDAAHTTLWPAVSEWFAAR
jgi:polyhydroxyalkanoate synthase